MNTLFIAAALLFSAHLQAQTPEMRARIEGVVAAFNGTAEDFEKHVAEAYTPALAATDTPAQRADFLRNVKRDFGTMEITEVRREGPNRVSIGISGSTGMRGAIVIEHEPEAPHKLTNLMVMLGERGGPGPGGPGGPGPGPGGPRAGGPGPGGPGPRPGSGPALPPVPVNAAMKAEELSTALDTYIGRMSADDRFAGTVLVARDGQPVFEKSYGMANRSDSVPNTPRTRFNIGSINKHLTGISIAQLVAAGKLSTSETIAKYLPDYPNADARNVTLQQLLDMNAGLADFFSPDFDATAKQRFRRNRDYYQYVAPKPLNFPPGTRKEYCNACYIVLGEIVERVSGIPYEQYVTENVFRRAGMQNATFLSSDDIVPNVAIGYTRRDGTLRNNVLNHGAGGSAAGSAYATARDLLTLDEALRRSVVLDDARVSTFFKMGGKVNGRAAGPTMYAGGSAGINAGVASGPTWTVVALANIDPPAAEGLASAIYRSLAESK